MWLHCTQDRFPTLLRFRCHWIRCIPLSPSSGHWCRLYTVRWVAHAAAGGTLYRLWEGISPSSASVAPPSVPRLTAAASKIANSFFYFFAMVSLLSLTMSEVELDGSRTVLTNTVVASRALRPGVSAGLPFASVPSPYTGSVIFRLLFQNILLFSPFLRHTFNSRRQYRDRSHWERPLWISVHQSRTRSFLHHLSLRLIW